MLVPVPDAPASKTTPDTGARAGGLPGAAAGWSTGAKVAAGTAAVVGVGAAAVGGAILGDHIAEHGWDATVEAAGEGLADAGEAIEDFAVDAGEFIVDAAEDTLAAVRHTNRTPQGHRSKGFGQFFIFV